MAVIQTHSTPAVFNFDDQGILNTQGKKIANPIELAYIKLSAGGGAAAVSVYDGATSADVTPANKKIQLDCSNTDNDTMIFTNPPAFSKGIYVVLDQGQGINAILSFASVG